ncbi:MAG: hypothetical protein K5888_11390 [Lachnospiraceae bacterium]|nr:hypothetical protein [Lachnospiraceae bacterium]
MDKSNENKVMRVLSALGIIFIAAGHIELGFFDIKGIFPYYSFHVYIFLFIAGYFYDPASEKAPFKYVLKKAKAFLVPYFFFNLLYGILSTVLNTKGFSIGQDLSLYSFLAEPFMGGHQYMLNAPSWFLISLFFVEVLNVFVRKLLATLHPDNEWILFALYTVMGIVTVFLAIGGHVWGPYKDFGRIFIMMFGFGLGRIYRTKLEPLKPAADNIEGVLSLCAALGFVFIAQMLLVKVCAGLAFSTVWVTAFANGPVVPFVSVTTGILFWLLISELIVKLLSISGITEKILEGICIIGRSTKSIMLHHIFTIFIINSIVCKLYMGGKGFVHFDMDKYLTDVYYVYGRGIYEYPKWIYLIICILIPVLLFHLYKSTIGKKSLVTAFFAVLILTGCSKETKPYVAKDPLMESQVVSEVINGDGVKDNPDDILSVPTYITKIDGLYFIVDCYHNRVIYSESLDAPLYTWKIMTEDINMGHTVASDGQVYLVDDTENNRILVFEKGIGAENVPSFTLTQKFEGIGKRPHYIIYDEKTDTFYAWSSLTGQMYLFRHEEGSTRMYLTDIKSIPELDGFYVRSFTIIGDSVFFVSGNLNIIEADLQSFEIRKRYPVPDEIAGMVQLTKIEDMYYITVSTDINADQSAATIIRTKDLNDLAGGGYEDIYEKFIGGGTPYCITNIDDTYYLCEHRLPAHSIWSFKVKDNEIVDIRTVF